ncbi:Uncharacterised protein r2_g3767 [Pycnogonum litorale]
MRRLAIRDNLVTYFPSLIDNLLTATSNRPSNYRNRLGVLTEKNVQASNSTTLVRVSASNMQRAAHSPSNEMGVAIQEIPRIVKKKLNLMNRNVQESISSQRTRLSFTIAELIDARMQLTCKQTIFHLF